MIGKILSPTLLEIETALIEFELSSKSKPEYSNEGFRAAIKIFMSVLMDKMFDLQKNEDLDMEDRINMAEKAGKEIRSFIKTYTNIDTYELY
jgi:hypothetical protein